MLNFPTTNRRASKKALRLRARRHFGSHDVCVPALGLEVCCVLPLTESHTDNRGELRSAIDSIVHCPRIIAKLLAAANSDFLCWGIQGRFYKWNASHWCNQTGRIPSVDLYEPMLSALDNCY